MLDLRKMLCRVVRLMQQYPLLLSTHLTRFPVKSIFVSIACLFTGLLTTSPAISSTCTTASNNTPLSIYTNQTATSDINLSGFNVNDKVSGIYVTYSYYKSQGASLRFYINKLNNNTSDIMFLGDDSAGSNSVTSESSAPMSFNASVNGTWRVTGYQDKSYFYSQTPSASKLYDWMLTVCYDLICPSVDSFTASRAKISAIAGETVEFSSTILNALDTQQWALSVFNGTTDTTIKSGTGGFSSYTWNGRDSYDYDFPNGNYTAKLTVTDAECSSTKEVPIPIIIENICPTINSFTFSKTSFNPSAGETANFIVDIQNSSITTMNWNVTLAGRTYGSGQTTWDGKDSNGRILPPGTYPATLTVTAGRCFDTRTATIQIVAPRPETTSSNNGGATASLKMCANSTNDAISGTLSHSQELFSTKGVPLATSMVLFYNTTDPYDGPLGLGWSHGYDTFLKINPYDGSALLREGSGDQRFYAVSGGNFVSQPGDHSTLVKNADNTYTVSYRNGLKYNFSSTGKLTAITDRFNNRLDFAYTVDDDLSTIVDPAGRTTTLGYDPANPHRIDYITDPDGNVFNFKYQGNTLWQVINPAADPAVSAERGYWEQTYYPDGYMKTRRDPNGNVSQYSYYPDHRLQSAVDPEGATNPAGHTRSYTYSSTDKTTTFTEKDGGVWKYIYDPTEWVLKERVDPNDKATSYSYYSQGLIKSATKPEDDGVRLTTFYRYDSYGNLTDETEPVNLALYGITDPATVDTATIGMPESPLKWAFRYAYDTNYYDERSSVTDLRGVAPLTTTFERYQENGLFVTRVTEPGQDVATPRISYLRQNPDGSLQSTTDANGRTASFIYYPRIQANIDAGIAGMLQSITDKSGITTTYTDYDKNGNAREVKVKGADNQDLPVNSTMTYDNLNRLGNVTSKSTAAPAAFPDNVTKYAYDNEGNVVSQIDAESRETKYQYNFMGKRTKVTDALLNATDFVYSGSGCSSCGAGVDQLTGIRHNGVTQISYQYDKLGRLEYETDPINRKIRYAYYDSGLLKEKYDATTAPEKLIVTYAYNNRGQVTDRIYTDGRSDHFDYKANGSLESATTAFNGTTIISYTYDYHDDGRLKSVTDNAGRTIGYDLYDGLGQRKQVTVLKGAPDQRVISYDYDSANRPWHIFSSAGTFTFDYDTRGRRKTLYYPNQTKASYLYDDLDRLTSLTHSVVSGPAFASLTYPEFDGLGNRKAAGRDGDQWNYLYNELYRLLEKVSPAQPEKFVYDAIGNRQSGPGAKDTDYLHNRANQMTQGRKLEYGYSNTGNQTTRMEPWAGDKSWTQTWDNENRLVKVEKVKGTEKRTVSFTYDPFGRRTGKTLTTVIDGVTKTSTWSYVYDGDSIAVEIYTDANNTTTKTYYTQGLGIDEHLAMERSGQFYYYHADGLGSIVSITDGNHNVVQSYEYDSYGMVKPSSPTFVNSYTYTGREWDREAGLYFDRARYYDPMEGRFISKDPIGFAGGDLNVYVYVQNNPLNLVDPFGLESFDPKKFANLAIGTGAITYYSTKYNDLLLKGANWLTDKLKGRAFGDIPSEPIKITPLYVIKKVFTPTELSDPILKNGNWVFPEGDMRPNTCSIH